MLKEIDAREVPRFRIFNKIDHVSDAAAQAEPEAALRADYPGCIVMSARRPNDVAKLRSEIFARCKVLEERADEDGAFFRVRGEQGTLDSLREQISQAQ